MMPGPSEEILTCTACGSPQTPGSAFCAVCGMPFPRTGQQPTGTPQAPVGQVQRSAQAGADGAARVEHHPGVTTEPEHVALTQRPGAGPAGYVPPGGLPVAPPYVAGQVSVGTAPYAGVGRRFLAYLVDGVAIGIVTVAILAAGAGSAGVELTGGLTAVPVEQLAKLQSFGAIAGAVGLLYWLAIWAWEGRTGKTLGNLLLGLRTVDLGQRIPIGFGRAALRWILVMVGSIACGVGQLLVVLSPAFDKSGRRQGWQDKAARAVVLDVRGVPAGPTAALAPASAVAPTAAAWPGQQGPLPAVAPAAPAASPAPAVPDPWAFPSTPPAPVQASSVITGVPGLAPPAPQRDQAPPPPPAPTAPPAPAAPPAAPPAPPVAAALPEPAPTPHPVPDEPEWDSTRLTVRGVVLELESGERVVVDGPALVGRNPQAPADESWILVQVDDPTRSVSKTHVELGVDAGGLWLQDRGSTNGTILTAPGASSVVVEPGVRLTVPVGSTIQVGDRRILVHRDVTP